MNSGEKLRNRLKKNEILPLIGIYDAFSATIASRYYDGLFVSGFSFAASHYGLPDIGFIAWPDVVNFVQRLRALLPQQYIVVDIDDGYCDPEVACFVTASLEKIGASGIIIEDQQRPRRCGHVAGKQVMPLAEFMEKLQSVLSVRRDLVVIARTDVSDFEQALERIIAFSDMGADAVLVDAVPDLSWLPALREQIACPLVFNQIAGGKSPAVSLIELQSLGVGMVNYSTPCLFSAQAAIQQTMLSLQQNNGVLPENESANITNCLQLLMQNLDQDK